jgi:hypothetical protein
MATTTINLGLSLDGLSNVDSTGKATGDVLEWNAVTSKWEAATPSGGGGTPAGSNGEIQFNNSGAFGADSGLVWNNTNKRLGVGATPATTLDVKGSATSGFDVIRFQSQYSKVGFLGTDNSQAWLSSGAGQSESYFSVSSTQARIKSSNTIFFNGSNVEIANFGGTMNGFNIGPSATPQARLDVRAQGALSTDIAFRVRNSADTADLFSVAGNGSQISNATTLNAENFIWRYNGTRQASLTNTANAGIFRVFEGANIIYDLDARTAATFNKLIDVTGNSIFRIATGGAGTFTVRDAITATSNYQLASTSGGVLCDFNGSNGRIVRIDSRASEGAIQVKTSGGTPAVVADTFKLYSADITAGNAAPHFRTENGNIIKLYRETTGIAAAAFVSNTSLIVDDSATYGGYTMGQVVAALKAQGLLA